MSGSYVELIHRKIRVSLMRIKARIRDYSSHTCCSISYYYLLLFIYFFFFGGNFPTIPRFSIENFIGEIVKEFSEHILEEERS